MSDPIWLPDVLRAAGLTCDIYPGAMDRGHGDFGAIWGVVCHHTGSFGETPRGIAQHPALGLASQLYLSPEGKYTLCGVGVAWHAGAGSWPGIAANNANACTIGIEAANDGGGRPGLPHRASWSDAQYDAYVIGVAAILKKLNQPASHAIAHKEWAGAAQGKWDPGAIDMSVFRADVARQMGETSVPPKPGNPGPVYLSVGDRGPNVLTLQRRLQRNYSKLKVDGYYGPDTAWRVSDYQRLHGLEVDGIVGPKTAASLKITLTAEAA